MITTTTTKWKDNFTKFRNVTNLMAACFQLRQQLVYKHELSRGFNQRREVDRLSVLADEVRVVFAHNLLLGAIDEERVITTFSQFHHRVHEIRNIGRGHRSFVEEREVALKYRSVEFLLDRCQFDLEKGMKHKSKV